MPSLYDKFASLINPSFAASLWVRHLYGFLLAEHISFVIYCVVGLVKCTDEYPYCIYLIKGSQFQAT